MQMGDAIESIANAAGEKLTTPDRAVVTVAGTIERHTDDPRLELAVLGEHARHMGPMVLYREAVRARQLLSERAGCVLRMSIVCDGQVGPRESIHPYQIAHGFAERYERVVVLQVANVLTDNGLTIHHERHGVLEIRAEGQDRVTRGELCDDARRVPT